jgi:hypothetical protein
MSANSNQVIKFANSIVPVGVKNGVNLEFKAPEKFLPDSLQVFLSCGNLDKGLDFLVEPDGETFLIVLEPSDPTRLNVPPLQYESFRINYIIA